jgi:hypothetical protein
MWPALQIFTLCWCLVLSLFLLSCRKFLSLIAMHGVKLVCVCIYMCVWFAFVELINFMLCTIDLWIETCRRVPMIYLVQWKNLYECFIWDHVLGKPSCELGLCGKDATICMEAMDRGAGLAGARIKFRY